MFGQSSLLREGPATRTVERRLLAVVPSNRRTFHPRGGITPDLLLGVTGHAVVADSALPALAALVDLVLVPCVLHQGLVVSKLGVTIRAKEYTGFG